MTRASRFFKYAISGKGKMMVSINYTGQSLFIINLFLGSNNINLSYTRIIRLIISNLFFNIIFFLDFIIAGFPCSFIPLRIPSLAAFALHFLLSRPWFPHQLHILLVVGLYFNSNLLFWLLLLDLLLL